VGTLINFEKWLAEYPKKSSSSFNISPGGIALSLFIMLS
jgi:hypothetical protein